MLELFRCWQWVSVAGHVNLPVSIREFRLGLPPVSWPPLPVHHEGVGLVPHCQLSFRDPHPLCVHKHCIPSRQVQDLRVGPFQEGCRVPCARIIGSPHQASHVCPC
eukprot:3936111-Rhodomonas_salina.2